MLEMRRREQAFLNPFRNKRRTIEPIEWCVPALPLGVAIVLHIRFLGHANALWRDEINSINLASMPSLADVWRFSEFDSFPLFISFVVDLAASSLDWHSAAIVKRRLRIPLLGEVEEDDRVGANRAELEPGCALDVLRDGPRLRAAARVVSSGTLLKTRRFTLGVL